MGVTQKNKVVFLNKGG